jgi:rubrerythrin
MENYHLSTQRQLFRILEDAIKREDEAVDIYTEAATHTDDPHVREFLNKLAGMEREHHVLLEQKLDELKAVAELQDEINEAFE